MRGSLKYVISEKKLTKTRENEPPKFRYGLLQTLFPVIDETSSWNSSDIVLQIQLITGLTEEQVRNIVLQGNNFKKVNTALQKKPDLTETYPAFILLSDRKVDSLFIAKNCSKLGITLHTRCGDSICTKLLKCILIKQILRYSDISCIYLLGSSKYYHWNNLTCFLLHLTIMPMLTCSTSEG